jgi:hypothetical protein
MNTENDLGDRIMDALDRCPDFAADRSGHTKKVLRYRTLAGTPFAVRRDITSSARFWTLANDRFKREIEASGFECGYSEPSAGRTSNLDQIAEFKGAALHYTTVTTSEQALLVASKLVR